MTTTPVAPRTSTPRRRTAASRHRALVASIGALLSLGAICVVPAASASANTQTGYTLSVVAGTGAAGKVVPGPATSSPLQGPSGVTVDRSGNLYIADTFNEAIEKVTPQGVLSIVAGSTNTGVPTPGPALASKFNAPEGITIDAAGNLFIGDFNNRSIEKVTPTGTLSIFAGTGTCCAAPVPGPATASSLYGAADMALDPAGNLYVVNQEQVLKITPAGQLSVVAGTGVEGAPTPGRALDSKLGNPAGLAIDSASNIYLTDQDQNEVLKITPQGVLSIIAGNGRQGPPTPGPALASSFNDPTSVAVDGAGNLYVGDTQNHLVEKITPGGTLSVIAGTGSTGQPTPGPATSSNIFPYRLTVDAAGDLYVADLGFNVIEKLTPPPSAPTTPTAVVATSAYHSVQLSWSPPLSTGGHPLTSYQLFEGTRPGHESTTPIQTLSASATSTVVTGLIPWQSYDFTLKAVNAIGTSPASVEVTAPACDTALSATHNLLGVGQELFSANNAYRLILQTDGNLVVYNTATNHFLFYSRTYLANKGTELSLAKGVLHLTGTTGKVVWTPKAKPGTAASLVLENNGSLELLTSTGAVLWTGTAANPGG